MRQHFDWWNTLVLVRSLVLPATEKAVLVEMALHASGGRAWPSVARLVLLTGLARRTVQKAISGLEERSLISSEGRFRPDGSQASTVREFNFQSMVEFIGNNGSATGYRFALSGSSLVVTAPGGDDDDGGLGVVAAGPDGQTGGAHESVGGGVSGAGVGARGALQRSIQGSIQEQERNKGKGSRSRNERAAGVHRVDFEGRSVPIVGSLRHRFVLVCEGDSSRWRIRPTRPDALERWRERFGGVQHEDELARAEAWFQCNPDAVKGRKSIDLFLDRWFERSSKDAKGGNTNGNARSNARGSGSANHAGRERSRGKAYYLSRLTLFDVAEAGSEEGSPSLAEGETFAGSGACEGLS